MWAVASNAPFRLYKKFIHEGGIATPMIISWPAGISNPGRLEKNPAHISDIMPTIIEIAGAKYPESFKGNEITQMAGTSFLNTLKGKNTKPRKPIFWEHENHAGVRDGNWKLVTLDYTNPEMWELYDLSTDPTEIIDLARTRTDQLSKMVVQWESWAGEVRVEPKERVRRD